jgi:hypothetical protein
VPVADVLVATAAASPKVRTFRSDAFGRRIDQFDHFAFGELLFLPHDFRRDVLAIDRERNEDRFAFIACDTFATEGDIFDFEFNPPH